MECFESGSSSGPQQPKGHSPATMEQSLKYPSQVSGPPTAILDQWGFSSRSQRPSLPGNIFRPIDETRRPPPPSYPDRRRRSTTLNRLNANKWMFNSCTVTSQASNAAAALCVCVWRRRALTRCRNSVSTPWGRDTQVLEIRKKG